MRVGVRSNAEAARRPARRLIGVAAVLVSPIEVRERPPRGQAAGSIWEMWTMFVAMSNVPVTFTFWPSKRFTLPCWSSL